MKKSENNTEATEGENSKIWSDPRFFHLVNDPRFKSLPKAVRKVKIDNRFESMFNDRKFQIKYTVDKYGRKVNQSSSDDLKKFYDIGSSDEEQEEKEKQEEEKQITNEKEDPGENDALQSDGEIVSTALKKRLLDSTIDYARGEGRLISDSSSDEESSEEDESELYLEHVWGELDRDAETTEESTKRLAACNMDWDRIRASDIMVLCNSFLPSGGSIISVTIYPSEFGKERMAEEEKHGPPELTKKESNCKESDSEDELVAEQDSDAEEGDDYHMEKLREYQLNRLKYYYAVIECDSVQTADKIYKECDGIEYESSATKLDLRFVPDEMIFHEKPHEICTKLPDLAQYNPRSFTTTALQQATVDLTWDETSIERRELGEKLINGKLDEIDEADLRNFIAYSSEEETTSEAEEQEQAIEKNTLTTSKKAGKENSVAKYKALIQEITEKEQNAKKNKFDMEFSWDVAAAEKDTNEDTDAANEKVAAPTVIEKILQKRSEKNKRRKEERKKKQKQLEGEDADLVDSDETDTIPDGIDMNDPYFAEEFAGGDFKASKNKKTNKKKKNRKSDSNDKDEEKKQAKELELLMDDEDDGKQHFSLEKIVKNEEDKKSKKKRRKQLKKSKNGVPSTNNDVEDNFEINVNDDRFKAVFSSHHFNIDPTDSHFKKTKGMEKLIQEKLKRRQEPTESLDGPTELKRSKNAIEDNLLVKNLKRKLQIQALKRK